MKSLLLLVLLLPCFLAFTSLQQNRKNNWDYILFVQVWPGSWIYEDHSKYNFTNDYFTVHGLWPEYNNGKYPQFCNKTERFNLTKLDPIRNELEKYWTNFKNPIKFWSACITGNLENLRFSEETRI
jgi:ribonuclease T2